MCTRGTSYKCSRCKKKVQRDEAYCDECYNQDRNEDVAELKEEMKELEEKLDYYREELNHERGGTAIDIVRFIRKMPRNTTRNTIIKFIMQAFYESDYSDS